MGPRGSASSDLLEEAMSPGFIGSSGKHNGDALLYKLTNTEVLEGGVSDLKGLMLGTPVVAGVHQSGKASPKGTALPSFGSAIKSGSLPSNPDELVAIGVTKISEISAVWAHARRILD